jgi:hypothetical protein
MLKLNESQLADLPQWEKDFAATLPEVAIVLDVPYQTSVAWVRDLGIKPQIKLKGIKRPRFSTFDALNINIAKHLLAQGISKRSVKKFLNYFPSLAIDPATLCAGFFVIVDIPGADPEIRFYADFSNEVVGAIRELALLAVNCAFVTVGAIQQDFFSRYRAWKNREEYKPPSVGEAVKRALSQYATRIPKESEV